jgi:hypothetical protein
VTPSNTDVVAQVATLKTEAARATALRAHADAQLGVAKQTLDKIDAQLRELGVDPANAEQEFLLLEQQTGTPATQLQAALRAEIAAYNEILAVAK